LLGTHQSSQTASTTASRPAAADATASQVPPKVKQAVEQDVAATRPSNVPKPRTITSRRSKSRHQYKLGDNGERVFLTSEEIDTQRLNAKQEADAICSGN
jgi:hypothetical protein